MRRQDGLQFQACGSENAATVSQGRESLLTLVSRGRRGINPGRRTIKVAEDSQPGHTLNLAKGKKCTEDCTKGQLPPAGTFRSADLRYRTAEPKSEILVGSAKLSARSHNILNDLVRFTEPVRLYKLSHHARFVLPNSTRLLNVSVVCPQQRWLLCRRAVCYTCG